MFVLEFTSDSSSPSPKVQATIVGSIKQSNSTFQSKTVATKLVTSVPKSESPIVTPVVTPMSVLSVPTAAIVTSNGLHDSHTGTSLALAKQVTAKFYSVSYM